MLVNNVYFRGEEGATPESGEMRQGRIFEEK
jgi:hypothetical protein